jgi:hypothetical protein
MDFKIDYGREITLVGANTLAGELGCAKCAPVYDASTGRRCPIRATPARLHRSSLHALHALDTARRPTRHMHLSRHNISSCAIYSMAVCSVGHLCLHAWHALFHNPAVIMRCMLSSTPAAAQPNAPYAPLFRLSWWLLSMLSMLCMHSGRQHMSAYFACPACYHA